MTISDKLFFSASVVSCIILRVYFIIYLRNKWPVNVKCLVKCFMLSYMEVVMSCNVNALLVCFDLFQRLMRVRCVTMYHFSRAFNIYRDLDRFCTSTFYHIFQQWAWLEMLFDSNFSPHPGPQKILSEIQHAFFIVVNPELLRSRQSSGGSEFNRRKSKLEIY